MPLSSPPPLRGRDRVGGLPAVANNVARALRQRLTEEERILWAELRKNRLGGFRFRRQHPIGPYVVDFVCLERHLIVEVDGVQHGFDSNRQREQTRTRFLETAGYEIFRVWNGELRENLVGVCDTLLSELEKNPIRSRTGRHPHPDPPPSRGRERTKDRRAR